MTRDALSGRHERARRLARPRRSHSRRAAERQMRTIRNRMILIAFPCERPRTILRRVPSTTQGTATSCARLLSLSRSAALSLSASTAAAIAQTPEPRPIYTAACAACHGADGRGRTQSEVGFEVPLPDFTDCDFAVREPDSDWSAIAHRGGRSAASTADARFRRSAAARGDQAALARIRAFCTRRALAARRAEHAPCAVHGEGVPGRRSRHHDDDRQRGPRLVHPRVPLGTTLRTGEPDRDQGARHAGRSRRSGRLEERHRRSRARRQAHAAARPCTRRDLERRRRARAADRRRGERLRQRHDRIRVVHHVRQGVAERRVRADPGRSSSSRATARSKTRPRCGRYRQDMDHRRAVRPQPARRSSRCSARELDGGETEWESYRSFK